jgi:hypothetical protein
MPAREVNVVYAADPPAGGCLLLPPLLNGFGAPGSSCWRPLGARWRPVLAPETRVTR